MIRISERCFIALATVLGSSFETVVNGIRESDNHPVGQIMDIAMTKIVSDDLVIDEYQKLQVSKALKPDMRTHCSIEWGLWLATGQEVDWPRLLRTDYGAVWIDGMITVKLQLRFRRLTKDYETILSDLRTQHAEEVNQLYERITRFEHDQEQTEAYAKAMQLDIERWKNGVRQLQDGNSRLPKAVTSFLNAMVDGDSGDKAPMPYDASLELDTNT